MIVDAIPRLLAAFEDRLKAIAFLPRIGHGYEQPPYEQIDRERYDEMVRELQPLRGRLEHEEEQEARFCEGEACDLV